MAALEAAVCLSSASSSSASKIFFSRLPPPCSARLQNKNFLCGLSLKFPLSHLSCPPRKFCIQQCSAVQEVTVEAEPEKAQELLLKRKIYVSNFSWSFSAGDLKTLFGQCGTVTDVEIIRDEDGKHKGYAFLTMASEEEAQAAIEKFDSQEVSGRTLKVAYAKRLKKLSPPPIQVSPAKETRHKLYVSNLAWKVRATHLREFFSTGNFTPVSARVVFDATSAKSAGYGFVSFTTKEEAEAAIAALHGKMREYGATNVETPKCVATDVGAKTLMIGGVQKRRIHPIYTVWELMGRPVRLTFSERSVEPESKEEEEEDEEKVDETPPPENS